MASYSSMFGSMLTFVIFLGGRGMLSFCLLCVVVMFGPVSRVFFHFFKLRMISLEIVCPGSGVVLDCIDS